MRRIIFAFVALSLTGSASAVATCGPWIPQSNGTAWRLCTSDQAVRYCELKSGRHIRRMVCPD